MGGHGVASTCRCSSCSSERGAGDGGGHAGAVRPARGHARRRSGRPLSALPARGAHGGPRPRRARASRHRLRGARRGGAPRRGRLRAGRRGVRGPGPGPDCARSARWRASSCGPPRPPTRCSRWWPPSPGCACSSAPASRSHERRFGHFDGGFWLPECAYVPGLERELADHGVRAFCVDQPGASPATGGHRGGTGRRSDRLGDDLAGLERDARGYPAHPLYRDYHHRTTHDLRPWSNSGEPYDPEAARVQAHAHARDFVDRGRSRNGRPGLLLRWTPSCSGTGGTRAWSGCSAVLEEAPAARPGPGHGQRGHRARRAGARRAAGIELGQGQGPVHLGLAAGGRAGLQRPARRARPARGRVRGARAWRAGCASCSRCSPATGPSS